MTEECVILNGKQLSIGDVVRIARDRVQVAIDPQAYEIIQAGRQFVLESLECEGPVYGLNRGVGANKDKQVANDFFEEFNRNLILSHCVAVEPEASEEQVRATMLARLNTLLVGCTGIQPAIVTMYQDFLNQQIHPVMPERGSVGEADITCLSHIGLAMIGEGEVIFHGIRLPAIEAIAKAGLEPIKLGPKDGLAIVSSNALSAGKGALALQDAATIIELADLVYALSLEGLKGNVSPLDEGVYKVRPFPGQAESAEWVRRYLAGSYLWQPEITQTLQDPLSFRGSCHVHGSVRDALAYVTTYLSIQLNSSDDNPCLLLDEKRILPCSNYEVTSWVIGFEMLGIALSHLSKNACYRTIKLGTPAFTGLTRFLTPEEGKVIAFGTIQKTFTALDAEIRHLSNPTTADYYAVAGDMEDHASNAPYVVTKTTKMIDNLYTILGIEAMHAAQAIDLRQDVCLGKGTRAVYEAIRLEIPFLDRDRALSPDIKKAYELMKSGKLLKLAKEACNK